MSLEDRVDRIDDRLKYLEGIVDGGDVQARESVAYVISLVVQHLHEIGVLDVDRLKEYLESHGAEPSNADDYMGHAVSGLVAMIDFQRRQS